MARTLFRSRTHWGAGSLYFPYHGRRPCRHALNLAHVSMVHAGHLSIVPSDCDRSPACFGDNATISGIASPINAGALLEFLRFVDCHCCFSGASASLREDCEAKSSYCSSGSGGAEPFSSASSGPLLSRTSVSSNSVMVITPGTGSSITSTTTVSTVRVLGGFTGLAVFRATLFARARLGLTSANRFLGVGLATARLTALRREDLEVLRALRCVVAFRFRTALFFP